MIASTLPKKIFELRKYLAISQSELGKSLGVSAMAISRWERDDGAPNGTILLRLGILADKNPQLCWSFWTSAGLTIGDVTRVLPAAEKKFRQSVPDLQIVHAGARQTTAKEDLVAIPFLNVFAAAGHEQGSSAQELSVARSKQVIAAPRLWCPNPNHTVCMRTKGSSMEPVLYDGYTVVVDQHQTDKKHLDGMMVIIHHEKYGLVVSRFWRIKDSYALISDNRTHEPVPFTAAWRIVGKVLWWIGETPK